MSKAEPVKLEPEILPDHYLSSGALTAGLPQEVIKISVDSGAVTKPMEKQWSILYVKTSVRKT